MSRGSVHEVRVVEQHQYRLTVGGRDQQPEDPGERRERVTRRGRAERQGAAEGIGLRAGQGLELSRQRVQQSVQRGERELGL